MFGHRQMAPWRVGVSGLWGSALIHTFTSDSLRGKVEFAKHRKLSTCKCPYRRAGNCGLSYKPNSYRA
ncbi:Delta-Aminolevulinic Acid Dehydratase [Manis pentadactyla]|nr:Delta-Aminolevulinic Acid Dehydratase [Manis pentadactyla]